MISSQQLAASFGTIYTLVSGKNIKIKSLVFHNTNTTSETVTLCIVANGGTAGATNQILNIALASGDTFEFSPSYPIVLTTTGQTVQAKSTTASKVNCFIFGVESNV